MDPIHERIPIERPHDVELSRHAAHDDRVRDDVAAVVQLASDSCGICRLTTLVETNGRKLASAIRRAPQAANAQAIDLFREIDDARNVGLVQTAR